MGTTLAVEEASPDSIAAAAASSPPDDGTRSPQPNQTMADRPSARRVIVPTTPFLPPAVCIPPTSSPSDTAEGSTQKEMTSRWLEEAGRASYSAGSTWEGADVGGVSPS